MPDGAVPGEEDRIGALPDDLLRRVLSFLTSRESVCTCVLARRWRNLWKSVPVVRVMVPLLIDREGEEALWFVNSLLLLRDRPPLHEVDIRTFLQQSSAPLNVELWLRYAASCHARVLRVSVHRIYSDRLSLPNMTLVSQHLTVFNIVGVRFEERTLDFSSCPVLEVIKMYDCGISAEKILCKSLRHLTMEMCFFAPYGRRTRISCPSLTALKLVANMGCTPSLESMPLLVTAFVGFDQHWYDHEECYDYCCDGGYYEHCSDNYCLACEYQDDDCVLLEGLCGATDLKLISDPQVIIWTRDFRWHHTFSKLKTLFLNEWCLAADLGGLVYFLEHSPILERLTLQLRFHKQQSMDGKDESYTPRKQFLVSTNLKVVKIKCHEEDERIHQIVKTLVSLGVPPDHIDNQQNDVWSD